MAKTDAEITLKVNMPPPTGPGVKELYTQLKGVVKATNEAIADTSEKTRDLSQAVRTMVERTKATGSSGMMTALQGSFGEGVGKAGTMDRQAAQIQKNLRKHSGRLDSIFAAYNAGKLTEEQALAYMRQPRTGIEMGAEAASDLNYTLSVTESDLAQNQGFDEVLDRHQKMMELQRGEAEGARAAAAEFEKLADARAEERDALDESEPLYEKRALLLTQQENQLRKNAAELVKEATAIENVNAKVRDQMDAYADTDEYRKETFDTIEKGEQKVTASKARIAVVMGKQAELDAKAIIDNQKLDEAAAKRAAAEEKRAAAEAKRAAQEEKIRAKELYQMELLGKKRLELAQIIKQLNAERKKAAANNDIEALQTLNMKMGVARSQMRALSMQGNVNKMLFAQQAANAQRFAQNVQTLSKGLGGMNQALKNGEVNFVGMSSAMTDMYFQFKQGMGGLAVFTMGLQALQDVVNSYAKSAKRLRELEKKNSENIREERDAYGTLLSVMRETKAERSRQSTINNLKGDYDQLNESIAAGTRLIEAQINTELRRQSLTQDDAAFQRTLRKHELGRKLATGEISREEYDLALLAMDEEAAIAGADASVAKAETEAMGAAERRKKLDDALRTKNQKAREAEYEASRYKLEAHEAEAMEETSKTLSGNVKEAEDELNKLIDELKRHDYNFGESVEGALEFGLSNATWGLIEWDGPMERKKKEIEKAQRNLDRARDQLNSHRGKMAKAMGGKANAREYIANKRAADERVSIARSEEASTQKEQQAARQAEVNANAKLDEAKNEAARTKDRAAKNRASMEETVKLEESERKAAEKRAEQIEKMEKDIDEKSLSELKAIRSRMLRNRREFRNRKSGRGYKDWTTAIERMDDRIEARKRRFSEQEEAVYVSGLNAEAGAGSRGAARSVRKRQGELDIAAVNRVWQDGRIEGKGEIETLKKNLDAAIKARNAAAQEIITDIINFALADQRTSEKMRKELVKLKRKTEGGVR